MAHPRASNLRLSLLALMALASALATAASRAAGEPDQRALEEYFEAKVRPVIANRCLDCHGSEKSKGGLRLDSREGMLKGAESGPVVLPGKPDESSLIAAIRYDGDVQMPPKGKLKDEEIAVLTEWVKRGAFWPTPRAGASTGAASASGPTTGDASSFKLTEAQRSFWSFLPVKHSPPPAVKGLAWSSSPIDQFILAKLEENNLAPAPMADKPTLIRRAYFDLIGLPPSPGEVAEFLHDDSPVAFERIVDRLLASPHYGERWGRYWLDVARYGEDQAHSFQPRLYPHGYRYRDWVVRSLNRDIPYDRFILEQIAGDQIEGPEAVLDRPRGPGLLRLRTGLLWRRPASRPVRRPDRHPDPWLLGAHRRLCPLP